EEHIYIPEKNAVKPSVFALKATGECLAPEIKPGDIVVFDTDLSPKDGNIVVVNKDSLVMCKKYRREGRREWLESNNDEIGMEAVEIKGTVIGIYHVPLK
ncbi:MAG: S24 family peptidase, partial [Dehalococcoidia bacterium]|nr:S24 family peptidase [Dehalococcoidia bacterium]